MALKKKKKKAAYLECPAVRARVLGVNVYRGFAKLSDLSDISKPDIYDHAKNPHGTQRDLSPAHARAAYTYIKNSELAFWPEVFLSARNKDVLTFIPLDPEISDLGMLQINKDLIKKRKNISISRVDGNHRLHFANGSEKGYSKVEKIVSFCIAYDLSPDEEIQIFKDINKNQKPMNTSHLDGIAVRLSKKDELKKRNPDLFIAERLGEDKQSPLYRKIFHGGRKPADFAIPLRGLRTGIQYMLTRSTQLPRLPDAEAQYRVIRNYFLAVKQWDAKAWNDPKQFIMLRGAGLWAICFLGAHVIDRALLNDHFEIQQLLTILNSGKKWDWSNKGDFVGMSGRSGALNISTQISRHLQDENRMSTKDLFRKIMSNN